jgi:hypothetical protein
MMQLKTTDKHGLKGLNPPEVGSRTSHHLVSQTKREKAAVSTFVESGHCSIKVCAKSGNGASV